MSCPVPLKTQFLQSVRLFAVTLTIRTVVQVEERASFRAGYFVCFSLLDTFLLLQVGCDPRVCVSTWPVLSIQTWLVNFPLFESHLLLTDDENVRHASLRVEVRVRLKLWGLLVVVGMHDVQVLAADEMRDHILHLLRRDRCWIDEEELEVDRSWGILVEEEIAVLLEQF